MKSIAPKTDFQTITKALLDNNKPFLPKFLHLFSDLSIEDFKDIEKDGARILKFIKEEWSVS